MRVAVWVQRLLALTWALVTASLLCLPATAGAQPSVEARRAAVAGEQQAVARLKEDLQARRQEMQATLAELGPGPVSPAMLEQARLDVAAARVQVESAQVDQQAAARVVQELDARIRQLEEEERSLRGALVGSAEAQAREPRLKTVQDELSEKRALLEIEKQHLANVQAAQQVIGERLAAAQGWAKTLQDLYLSQQEQNRQEALEDLQARLQKTQQSWLARAADWRKELTALAGQGPEKEPQQHLLEARILDAEERANLTQLELKLAQVKSRQSRLDETALTPDLPAEHLRKILEEAQAVRDDLGSSLSLLQRRVTLLEQHQQVVQKRQTLSRGPREVTDEESRLIGELLRTYRTQLGELKGLVQTAEAKVQAAKQAYEESERRGLLVRRPLPQDIAGWRALSQEVLWFPWAVLQTVWESSAGVVAQLVDSRPQRWVLAIAVLAAWLALVMWLKRALDLAIGGALARELSFSHNVVLVPMQLLRCTLPTLAVSGAILLFIRAAGTPLTGLHPVLTLMVIWVSVQAFSNLAWLLLMGPQIPEERRRPQLYTELRWLLIAGGVLTAVTALAHLITLSTVTRDFADRVYMLFLLLVTWPVLRIRSLLLEMLNAHVRQTYWRRVAWLLSLLFPLSTLAGAVLGLFGYVNLAWTVARYLGWFLLVLGVWLVLRGLLRDLARALKDYANRKSTYGLLWAQGVIDPLHRVARVALFLAAWMVLFRLYAWGAQSPVMRALQSVLQTSLFTIGTVSVDLQHVLLVLLTVIVLVWLGRWSRELTYRWVYARIVDLGVRHSLSVFTQYAVVLVGLLITLRIIGIDLTTLAIFAGALGVGIGFGLQNIANNLVSGIMLLIERPLRTGDIVNIGNREGKVTRIGMRSLTIRNWDYQEVIIPNSEIISNAFTNWTRSDNVLRIKLDIGVSYDDDPHQAKQVIERVLQSQPGVLREPPPGVWLAEFAPSSVNFHVQYFFDLNQQNGLELKSQVLLKLWDELKAAGLHIPYQQRDVRIKELPGSLRLALAQDTASAIRLVPGGGGKAGG